MVSSVREATGAARLRVLHVEDNSHDAELMAKVLDEAGCAVSWSRVETEDDYVNALKLLPDLVIADYRLPRFSGLRALEILKERQPDIPFIVVSGTIGEENAAETIRLG